MMCISSSDSDDSDAMSLSFHFSARKGKKSKKKNVAASVPLPGVPLVHDHRRLLAVTGSSIVPELEGSSARVVVRNGNPQWLTGSGQEVVVHVEVHFVPPRRFLEAAGESTVGMGRLVDISADPPQTNACRVRVDLSNEALVVTLDDFPSRVVVPGLLSALLHLANVDGIEVVDPGALPGIVGNDALVPTFVAPPGGSIISLGELVDVGRVQSLVEDHEPAPGGGWNELGGPLVEELEGKYGLVGIGSFQGRLGDVPNAQPGVQLLAIILIVSIERWQKEPVSTSTMM